MRFMKCWAGVGLLGAGVLGNSRLRETARPLRTNRAAASRFSGVMRLTAPIWSSLPQRPQLRSSLRYAKTSSFVGTRRSMYCPPYLDMYRSTIRNSADVDNRASRIPAPYPDASSPRAGEDTGGGEAMALLTPTFPSPIAVEGKSPAVSAGPEINGVYATTGIISRTAIAALMPMAVGAPKIAASAPSSRRPRGVEPMHN